MARRLRIPGLRTRPPYRRPFNTPKKYLSSTRRDRHYHRHKTADGRCGFIARRLLRMVRIPWAEEYPNHKPIRCASTSQAAELAFSLWLLGQIESTGGEVALVRDVCQGSPFNHRLAVIPTGVAVAVYDDADDPSPNNEYWPAPEDVAHEYGHWLASRVCGWRTVSDCLDFVSQEEEELAFRVELSLLAQSLGLTSGITLRSSRNMRLNDKELHRVVLEGDLLRNLIEPRARRRYANQADR